MRKHQWTRNGTSSKHLSPLCFIDGHLSSPNLELEPKSEDSGAYAVFTEQGSSASQMTAAKVMDVIARLPDSDGQAADAVSSYTQVNLEDAPRLLKNSRIRMSRHLDASPATQMAKVMVHYGRPSCYSRTKFV